MTDKKETYLNHITTLLNKVNNGEEVFPKPQPVSDLHKSLKEHGIKKVLTSLFQENYEIPSYLQEEQHETGIDGSTYKFVSVPSQFKDADNYWNSISSNFLHLGKPISNKNGCIDTKVMSSNNTEETLRICLVRDENPDKQDKPYIAFIFLNNKITPNEVIQFISKVGLKVDRTELKQINNWVVAEITK